MSAMTMNCLAKHGHKHANCKKSRADWKPIAAGKLADWKPSRFNFTSRIPNCYLQVFTCTCNLDSLSREVKSDPEGVQRTTFRKYSSFIRALLLGDQFLVLDGSCNVTSLASLLASTSTSLRPVVFPEKETCQP